MTAPDNLPVYPIRTVAALTGVDARRLRSWEALHGLLAPARTPGGHRLYSPCDLRRIREIRRLVDEEGMSLQGIRGWLAAPGEGAAAPLVRAAAPAAAHLDEPERREPPVGRARGRAGAAVRAHDAEGPGPR